MKKATIALLALLLPFSIGWGKCQDEALTAGEALQALEEVALSTQATQLANGTIEISTNFTIGQAVEAAAEELQEFIESQLPCAEITLVGAVLTIEYGALPGSCTYNGHTYSGSHSVEIVSATLGDLVVYHEWTDLSDGNVIVNGDSTVTWSSEDSSRNVVHELTWERVSDGKSVVGGGNRTQTLLPGGILEGIEIDGDRYWTSDRGDWDLSIDGIEIRWIDPVPQAGLFQLDTPFDKSVTMEFDRFDDDTIEVTVASGGEEFSFHVSKWGVISEE